MGYIQEELSQVTFVVTTRFILREAGLGWAEPAERLRLHLKATTSDLQHFLMLQKRVAC